jgi:hypothetical protein
MNRSPEKKPGSPMHGKWVPGICPYCKSWVPHISLVFREMWDSTDLNRWRSTCESTLRLSTSAQSWRDTAVASHISRKTSEIPGFPVRNASQVPRVRLSLRKAARSELTQPHFTGNPGVWGTQDLRLSR